MRATKIGITMLASAGLLLAGCGGDDDGTTPQASTSSSDPAPDDSASEDESEDDGDGEASDDLVAWAGELCGAVAPLQDEALGEGLGTPSEIPTDPADIVAQLQQQFSQIGPVFAEARDAVEAAGPPPVDDGDAIYDNMLNVLGTAADAFAEIDDELAALDPSDPDALDSLEPFFTQLEEQMGSAGDELDAAFSSPEMEAAFEQAPECEGMDMTSP